MVEQPTAQHPGDHRDDDVVAGHCGLVLHGADTVLRQAAGRDGALVAESAVEPGVRSAQRRHGRVCGHAGDQVGYLARDDFLNQRGARRGRASAATAAS